MDEYTRKTKAWLDTRFRYYDEDGIYHAHQSIYGFRSDHAEPRPITRYLCLYQVLKALSRIPCRSVLDVGGAEGYKAYLARELLGVDVLLSDLSEEACMRGRDLFRLDSATADIHSLPFRDGSVDAVLCSETLEHVTDWQKALDEILRVARKAVVITVPYESEALIERLKETKESHTHIHSFTPKSFDFLLARNYRVFCSRLISPLLYFYELLLEPREVEHRNDSRYPRLFKTLYHASIPLLKRVMNERALASVIRLDEIACRFHKGCSGLLFVIRTDFEKGEGGRPRSVSAYQVVATTVPYLYRNKRAPEKT